MFWGGLGVRVVRVREECGWGGGGGNDGRDEWSRERGRWFVAECGDVGWVQYVDAVGGSLVVKGVEGRDV